MRPTHILHRLPTRRASRPASSHCASALKLPLQSCRKRPFSTSLPALQDEGRPQARNSLNTTIRDDLKLAMRAKDKPRLAVLRSILADITNWEKSQNTNAPFTVPTNVAVLRLLRKRASDSAEIARAFTDEGRSDLAEKEMEEESICREYAATVKVMSDEEMKATVDQAVGHIGKEGIELKKGILMKRLFGPDGLFFDKPVEKEKVMPLVDLALRAV